jgi:hypothetical protein
VLHPEMVLQKAVEAVARFAWIKAQWVKGTS